MTPVEAGHQTREYNLRHSLARVAGTAILTSVAIYFTDTFLASQSNN